MYFGWIFESYRKGGCKHVIVQYVGGEREGERHPHMGLEFNFHRKLPEGIYSS